MKGITLCADCAYYDLKKHKCNRGATVDPDISKGQDVRFYVDCPLDDVEPVRHWIPCSERLPEVDEEVLVYVKGDFDNSIPFITTAYINSDCDWQSDYDGEVIDSKITHWMPLPEPPESEV